MKQRIILLAALALLAVAGASAQATNPRLIDETKDLCASCNMMVHNDGYAVEAINKDGKIWTFDSISEAVGFAKSQKTEAKLFVQHALTKVWLEADNAFYAFSKAVKTPMAIGIHAFATAAERDAFLKGKADAKAVKFADVASYFNPASEAMEMKEDSATKADHKGKHK